MLKQSKQAIFFYFKIPFTSTNCNHTTVIKSSSGIIKPPCSQSEHNHSYRAKGPTVKWFWILALVLLNTSCQSLCYGSPGGLARQYFPPQVLVSATKDQLGEVVIRSDKILPLRTITSDPVTRRTEIEDLTVEHFSLHFHQVYLSQQSSLWDRRTTCLTPKTD